MSAKDINRYRFYTVSFLLFRYMRFCSPARTKGGMHIIRLSLRETRRQYLAV